MAKKTRKVTVTVPEDMAATLEQWRDAGRIPSVSEYVTSQVKAGMDRAESLRRIETIIGGPDSPRRPDLEHINRVQALLGLPPLTEADADAVSAEVWGTGAQSGAA